MTATSYFCRHVLPIRIAKDFAIPLTEQLPADTLVTLPSSVISPTEVYIPFLSPGMRQCMRAYDAAKACLVVDVKMNVAAPHAGIATISILAKCGLRKTTLSRVPARPRGGRGRGRGGRTAAAGHSARPRVQAVAHTTSAIPIMQAIFHEARRHQTHLCTLSAACHSHTCSVTTRDTSIASPVLFASSLVRRPLLTTSDC